MDKITKLKSEPNISLTLTGEDGEKIELILKYIPTQLGWFYSVSYLDFQQDNMRLVNSPNILRRFKRNIPFGLMCSVLDEGEPIFLNDFETERATLYLLNKEDVDNIEESIYGN